MRNIKLSIWAKENGYSYRGAYDMFIRGQLPNAYQMPSGAIMISTDVPNTNKPTNVAIYARVSTPKQKDDLTRQIDFVKSYCAANGFQINKIYKEIASGLNDDRHQLNKLLDDASLSMVVVSDKDRLTRFGFNYIKRLLNQRGCELVVINQADSEHADLIQDFVSVITSMAARVYGLRRHKSHVEHIINELDSF